MQDNMRAMAERDAQLSSLQSATENLQGSSDAFFRASRRVHRSQLWQRYRLYLLAGVLTSWVICWTALRPVAIFWLRAGGQLRGPGVDQEGGRETGPEVFGAFSPTPFSDRPRGHEGGSPENLAGIRPQRAWIWTIINASAGLPGPACV